MVKKLSRETSRPPIVTILGHVDHGKCVAGDTLIPLTDGRILKALEIFEIYSKDLQPELLPDGERFELKESLKIFSFNGDKIVVKNISYLWRLKSPDKLIKVTLYSGDSVMVTSEHPFYVFTSNGEIIQKRADELQAEEFVIVPKNLIPPSLKLTSLKRQILQKLADTGSWVVFLDGKESAEFWVRVKNFKISELIKQDIFSSDARAQIQKKRLRLSDYIRLGYFLGYSLPELYNFINTIKNSSSKWRAGHTSNSIKLPKTNEQFSKLGYILGCLVGDGSFDGNNIYLHNNDPEIYSAYSTYLTQIFGVTAKTSQGHTALITRTNGSKTLKRFICEAFDIPDKNKSQSVVIPSLVQTSFIMLNEFIAGLFDTDGYVSSINHSAEFTSKSSLLIRQLGVVLLYRGIHSRVYKKRDYSYLRIANKPYLELFLKSFHFRLTYKRDRIIASLDKSSVSRIFDYTPLSNNILKSLKVSNEIVPYWNSYQKTNGFLTRPFLKNLAQVRLLEYQNQMRSVLNTDISPVRIRQLEVIKSEDEYVYDFTVEETHNFVAERVIVHNTTLLDFIRKSSVAAREHGGITQHIGAYQVTHNSQLITFIDTPGHAAFEKMRSRGANVADIAVLVVAADDGIMPQTEEAIKHIKQAKVPPVVAINKIDLPTVNIKVQQDKIKKQLSDREILPEEYGGDVPVVSLSAKTGEGVDKLLENILLVAELNEIKGDASLPPAGVVIEANLDKFKGPVATLLVRNGTLKKGDSVMVGGVKGKIRGLFDFDGQSIDSAGPSTPVEVLGLEAVPAVGSTLGTEPPTTNHQLPTATLVDKLKQAEAKTLKVIIKADKQGSLEAIQASLDKFNVERKVVDYKFVATGDIGEENVKLAASVGAIIIGFNVKVVPSAQKLAENEQVLIRTYQIIYELLEDIEEVVNALLEVGQLEEVLGKAEIIAEFPYGKNERIAGCRMTEGVIAKGQRIRILRDGEMIGETKLKSLRKVKEEVNKVEKGNDCGMLFDPQLDFQIGDKVESFRVI